MSFACILLLTVRSFLHVRTFTYDTYNEERRKKDLFPPKNPITRDLMAFFRNDSLKLLSVPIFLLGAGRGPSQSGPENGEEDR